VSQISQVEVPSDHATFVGWRESARQFTTFVRTRPWQSGLLAAAYLFILSIIGLQNVPFFDDASRNLDGRTLWGLWDGRWGSELIAVALNAGTPIVDLGLIPFIVSAAFLTLASLIVVHTLVGTKANWIAYLVALALGLNPWYLNAAAYRFDGPFFAASVLVAVCSIWFYRDSLVSQLIGYAVLALVTANLFQSALGLMLTLLMTRLLLDWLGNQISIRTMMQRFGVAVAGIVIGGLLYFAQLRLVGAADRTTVPEFGFDLSNPIGGLRQNLPLFVRSFLADSSTLWTFFHLLILLIAVAVLLLRTQQPKLASAVAIVIYLGLSVLASGGVLLLVSGDHIGGFARFRFPLAMGIAMLAMIVSTTYRFPRPLALITKVALVGFAYTWLSVSFIFASVIREQHESLTFQAATVFADATAEYRPSDTILFDPIVLTNSLYYQRVAERFPIFAQSGYVEVNNTSFWTLRERLAGILGLPRDGIYTTADYPGICDRGRLATDPQHIRQGPRSETFRLDQNTICVVFPEFASVHRAANGAQLITVDLNRYPFGPGLRPDLAAIQPGQLQVAIWSAADPADVQWADAADIHDGIVTFEVSPPPSGWQQDVVAAHFFLNHALLFEQLWRY